MFYNGIIVVLIHVLILPILLLTKALTLKDNGDSYFSRFTSYADLMIFANIFSKFLKKICIMEILYIFTPQHVCFINSVSWLVIFFNNYFIFSKIDTALIVTYVFSFLFIILGTLLFNEMIILNIYDLNKYTKAKILEREKKDTLELDDSSTLIDNSLFNKEEDNLDINN